jgi:hypothetical protein
LIQYLNGSTKYRSDKKSDNEAGDGVFLGGAHPAAHSLHG